MIVLTMVGLVNEMMQTSLGDWEIIGKISYGIRGCAQAVNSVGLNETVRARNDFSEFKLYPTSRLVFNVPGRPMQRGNQLVLNMGRTDVQDYLQMYLKNY